jgi:hypothetical protein
MRHCGRFLVAFSLCGERMRMAQNIRDASQQSSFDSASDTKFRAQKRKKIDKHKSTSRSMLFRLETLNMRKVHLENPPA